MSRKGGRRARAGARRKWTRDQTRHVLRRSLHAAGVNGTVGLSLAELWLIFEQGRGVDYVDCKVETYALLRRSVTL